VALKILPEAFARDAERVARFEREARVLASLNHPHIAAIYGFEESGSPKFLVMELALGETLAQRIARGSIPLDDALAIAKQIAEALEAAHEKGIMHRDLKLANVKVAPGGNVKVLDFGLAKAFADEPSPAGAPEGFSNSPTLGAAATNPGVIVGRWPTCRPSRRRAPRSIGEPIFLHSAPCCTRC
jgi:serine/threonine-protein kinase